MKAIFLKELRENLKWGLLSLGFFLLSVAGWIHEAGSNLLFVMTRPETTGLPFAIIGLAMGLLQTWFETRPDNFAFVVHRPVSRLEIFIAKSAAGLLLIYISLVIPAAIVIAWAATPGHLSTPFQWRSTLPLLADICNVAPFYFTGMVLTMRKAHWFGSRLLPLGLAVASAIGVRIVPEFWQAMVIAACATSISAMAAWNVYSTAGVDDEGRISKFALGTMIFAGALGIGCVIISIQSIFQNAAHWHDLRVDRDGNVLAVSWTIANKERSCVVCDSNGTPLPEYEGVDPDEKTDDSPDRFLRFSTGLGDLDRIDAGWTTIADIYGYRTPTPGIVGLRTVAKPGTRLRRNCLFNVPERIIEMYDPVTEVLLGRVGPAGYTAADVEPKEKFPRAPLGPMSQSSTHTLAFPAAVYWMELDQKRARKIFEAPADDAVVAATELPPQNDPPVVVVTEKRFHVMKPTGEVAFSGEHGLDLNRWWFALAVIPSNNHLMLRAYPITTGVNDSRTQTILEFDTAGKLVRSTKPAAFPDDRPTTVRRRTAVAGFFYPLVGLPVFAPWVFDYIFEMDATYNWWLFHGVLFGAAALSALATLIISRRCGFGWKKTIGWTIANALLGPAGVVVMLSLNDWPSRETCASCGGKRLVGRQECSCCGNSLPPAAVDGREIFEPAEAFSSAV